MEKQIKLKTKPNDATKTKTKTQTKTKTIPSDVDFFEVLWERSMTYIKTVVDVVREPMVILDEDYRIMAANDPFYDTFKVPGKHTEGKSLFKIGNGQWNIPVLKKMLQEVLQEYSHFKGFQVAHEFPHIGRKVMILNARQIHIIDDGKIEGFPPIILLAMEDVTDMLAVAESLSNHANKIEAKFIERSEKLEITIERLENDLRKLRDK